MKKNGQKFCPAGPGRQNNLDVKKCRFCSNFFPAETVSRFIRQEYGRVVLIVSVVLIWRGGLQQRTTVGRCCCFFLFGEACPWALGTRGIP